MGRDDRPIIGRFCSIGERLKILLGRSPRDWVIT